MDCRRKTRAASRWASAHLRGDNRLSERLGTDIRYIAPPYTGPTLPSFADGSSMNLWGIRRRPMPNQYGEYAEPVEMPYAGWKTVEEAARLPLAGPRLVRLQCDSRHVRSTLTWRLPRAGPTCRISSTAWPSGGA